MKTKRGASMWLGGVGLLFFLIGGSTAEAKKAKVPQIDRSKIRVFHDGSRHYVALVVVTAKGGAKSTVYYGDGKRFHRMRGYTAGPVSSEKGGFYIEDPRVFGSEFHFSKSGGKAICKRTSRDERTTKLTELSRKESAAIAKRGKFLPPAKMRAAHVLARDALGIYYYVDRADSRDYSDFRLFVGEAGKMKRMVLKNVATDTVGQVFATKKGALQVRSAKRRLEAYEWVQLNRRDKHELVDIPLKVNMRLIYNVLGVYSGRLGTICDDL